MKKLGIAATLASAFAVIGIAAAGIAKEADPYRATMTPKQEVPEPNASAAARGAFTARVTANGAKRSLVWKLTFRNLSGKATAAHIHMGKPGVAGDVIVPLCGPCKSGATGRATVSKSAVDALDGSNAYVNVHTAKNAAGEIRGAIKTAGRR